MLPEEQLVDMRRLHRSVRLEAVPPYPIQSPLGRVHSVNRIPTTSGGLDLAIDDLSTAIAQYT